MRKDGICGTTLFTQVLDGLQNELSAIQGVHLQVLTNLKTEMQQQAYIYFVACSIFFEPLNRVWVEIIGIHNKFLFGSRECKRTDTAKDITDNFSRFEQLHDSPMLRL